MAQCVLEENKIKKSTRIANGKKNLYESLQTKLANIESEIIQYKWEMKRKPLFHKYDAIYALKKNRLYC
jgi:predicted nucleic acid-binding protein